MPTRVSQRAASLPIEHIFESSSPGRHSCAQLGIHCKLPDAVREYNAAVEAAKKQDKEQYEESIRAAYRRADGSFRDGKGQLIRQVRALGARHAYQATLE